MPDLVDMSDEIVNEVIQDVLQAEAIQEAFCGFLENSTKNEEMKNQSCQHTFKFFWASRDPSTYDGILKAYVSAVYNQRNSKRSQKLFSMLEYLVENSIVSAKQVCEAVLHCDKLKHENEALWCQTFQLLRKIVGGVDYKGCRDLFRLVLEKCQTIPMSANVSAVRQLDAALNVISYILDRNACLLPSYFAVNEIVKLTSEDRGGGPWPHWKLGQILSDFVETFRPTAQMVTLPGRRHLLPVVGHSSTTASAWRLTPTLKFPLHGPLPYDKEAQELQTDLLRYVLEQPYSRDMVCNMLSLNKQVKLRCLVLEEQLVELIVLAMERSESEDTSTEGSVVSQLLWQHLSSQLIFFVLFQFASFPHMVSSLYNKLKGSKLQKGRNHLMWVLLQFISGSIQKNPLQDFLPVLKLYDLLYTEKEPLSVPDIEKPYSTLSMAVTCIWIHLIRKAQTDNVKLKRPVPYTLKNHMDFLKQCLTVKNQPMPNYRIALLCNAYSTNTEYFSAPMSQLLEMIYGNGQSTTQLPGNITASAPSEPLPMDKLDSLTVHAKMSLIHSIVTRVIKHAHTKNTVALAPALVETYSRLLVYMEIESLGIKGFISQLLPTVVKSRAWGILHTLLEMFIYRLHHIQPHYRVQLLSHLHTLVALTNQNQLHLCVESTALRLINGLGSTEVQPQLSRFLQEPKSLALLSNESEELNRALVLTLARAMHVTGSDSLSNNWCKDIMTTIMQHTPHGWSSHTIACFPPALAEFFQQNPVPREEKTTLKRMVETEYRKWKSMNNESDLIAHFSMQGTPPLFICIIWRCLLEDGRVSTTAYKVLERLGSKTLSQHLRTFADYLVFEFATSGGGQQVQKCVNALNDMVWKCNIVTIDRLVLSLALRNLEGNEAQVCCLIIQLILLKPPDFTNRVKDFESENSPAHWKQKNWHEKHMAFHRKYPEKFYYEGLQDLSSPSQHQYLPVYFGNVCLRFLPVLDIVIHRFLELPSAQVSKSLENMLDHMGKLYKFHDRPVTYLYNTLHYYEKRLRDRPALKRRLVQSIIGAFKDIYPATWCVSEDYVSYMQRPADDIDWVPSEEYYIKLLARIVDTIAGKTPSPFLNCDWRFNEFPNPAAHALHATCIELMALPVASATVGSALMDTVLKNAAQVPREQIMSWMNAVGLILTALPDSYWMVINEKILFAVQTPILANFKPFEIFNFSTSHAVFGEVQCSYVLALCHALWHHASIGQISILPQFIKEQLKPVVHTEEQFLFICHLVGPFLQRFYAERTRCLLEFVVDLYEILEKVDKACEHLFHMDSISDFLYHIKYMFVGDGVKAEVDKIIFNLRPALKLRLRFISQRGKEETPQPSQ
ncbi:mediator of RNA polymerase II transcription subunit 23 [Lingula anatina]|uniref:Mediator of RNA polymerase II transcription subunit 23 n=1 Tax=Lingula anatina TaxID=7574 RepID=A0A1S3J3J4_LINAN|nr:mediator of RNA polymerase II transcription subunit 23 [Lingula anatina]|eukprot:XP_013404828.1 mediator of RNA polymerase II transcription subunit 23 [Lingula anatina]